MALRARWRLEAAGPFPEDLPPPGYEGAEYLRVPNRGTMMVHQAADRVLQAGPVQVMADETPYQLPAELRELAPIALHALRAGKVIFNDTHLGLRDDLLPASSSESRPLRLVETSYFDHVCSAELCQYTVIDQVTNAETEIRRIELIDPGGRLVTLAASRVANIIGVSTLAFTSDDLLLMVPQSKNNVASRRLYAPSGSGSLDPADWQAAGDGACLQDILVRGMERELCEETGISPDDVGQTQVVGFGRWLERGAKPEFFAVTRLKIRASDVKTAKVSAAEKIYSDRVRPVFVDLDRLEQELRPGQPIHGAPSYPQDVRKTGSLPLIAGLRAVALSGQGHGAGGGASRRGQWRRG
ncbi:MAG TPA: hypothetical protein VGM53_11270 [Streptosporangiaceae bacterium]